MEELERDLDIVRQARDELEAALGEREAAEAAERDAAADLARRAEQVEELEQDLAAALHEGAALQMRLDELEDLFPERERRLVQLESELETLRDELGGIRRAETQTAVVWNGDGSDDFLAAVGRAKDYLAARRAQLREREEQLQRLAGRVEA
jgi:chromosome segregation ATPase